MKMVKLDMEGSGPPKGGVAVHMLLDQDIVKVRRLRLASGARIPPCRMRDDVVFVVLEGSVTFCAGTEKARVVAPGAVFIPGGSTTRSLKADEPSLVVAVLCRRKPGRSKIEKGRNEP